MDDPIRSSKHSKSQQRNVHGGFAGRFPAGTEQHVTLSKDGVRHVRRVPNGGKEEKQEEILAIGLACSECFSGRNLYKVLEPGFEYEARAMVDLMRGLPASPLSIHTSSGVPDALSKFLEALEPHLPWKKVLDDGDVDDWCASLQLEGASAVWAAVDMLLQVGQLEPGTGKSNSSGRTKVAVGATSYHGPPSTSFGGKESPLWRKHHQVTYPTPKAGEDVDEERLLDDFVAFLDAHQHEVGVILFEPQWGSSQAAFPWPKNLLKRYVDLAKGRNIKVVCDEIMCGLGRHGQGTLFLSEAWDLDPDAVTFGKAIAAGVYPLSGAIVKRGRKLLQGSGRSVMQSHTYAGSSTRALMAATEVLREIPTWLPSVAKLGEEMEHIFRYINKVADGMVVCQGQGLMWGGLVTNAGQNRDAAFRSEVVDAFKESCGKVGVLPYFVPVGGFMVSPVIDIDVGTIYEIGERLEKAVAMTKEAVGWEKQPVDGGRGGDDAITIKQLATQISNSNNMNEKCHPLLHQTRSCTSCSSFVCKKLRTRFVGLNL